MKSFEGIMSLMRQHRMPVPDDRIGIQVPNAEQVLRQTLAAFLEKEGRTLQWLPEYQPIVDWLTDNKGLGLFLYGTCGRGKSLLCRYVLPAILLTHCRKIVSVYDVGEMNTAIDTVLTKRIISLDDIGTEEVVNTFGNKRLAFAEIADAAEKRSKLLIVSTNLSAAEIRNRYGERVLERIKSTTQRVLFTGESLR